MLACVARRMGFWHTSKGTFEGTYKKCSLSQTHQQLWIGYWVACAAHMRLHSTFYSWLTLAFQCKLQFSYSSYSSFVSSTVLYSTVARLAELAKLASWYSVHYWYSIQQCRHYYSRIITWYGILQQDAANWLECFGSKTNRHFVPGLFKNKTNHKSTVSIKLINNKHESIYYCIHASRVILLIF